MRHIQFKVVDGEMGIGIMPKKFKYWDNYNASYGATFAHDILEHLGNQTGTIMQEVRALGSLLFVRNFGYRFNGGMEGTSEANAENLPEQFRESTDLYIPECPKFYMPSEYADEMKEFLGYFKKHIEESWAKYPEYNGFDDEEKENWLENNWFLQNWDKVAENIKFGFYQAYKSYQKQDVYHLFEAIEEYTTKIMSSLNDYADTGVLFRLSYDLNGNVEIKMMGENEYGMETGWVELY